MKPHDRDDESTLLLGPGHGSETMDRMSARQSASPSGSLATAAHEDDDADDGKEAPLKRLFGAPEKVGKGKEEAEEEEEEEDAYGAYGARQENHGTLFPMMKTG